MKKIIIETFVKGIIFTLGIIFTIFAVFAVNGVINLQSVDNQTNLTSNLWNDTMSTLTGAINNLESTTVKLSGNQTISGVKTFSNPIVGVTPVLDTDLTTKAYVDTKVGASSAGTGSRVTINTICSGSYGGSCTPPECPNGYTELYLSDNFAVSHSAINGTSQNVFIVNRYRTCAKKM